MLTRDWLLVQGGSAEELREVATDGLHWFQQIHRLKPADTQQSGDTFVAAFGGAAGGTNSIVRVAATEKWGCASGAFLAPEVDGLELLERLALGTIEISAVEGTFGIALHDVALGSTQVVTDRLGTLHVYSARLGPVLMVSTSSMVLAAMVRPKWDLHSCREFLAMGTVFGQRTLFEGIDKLSPASVYEFRGGRQVSVDKHWNLADLLFDRASFTGTTEGLAEELRAAFRTIERHYPKAVLDLTGGFDSRALLGAMIASGVRFDTVVNGPPNHEDVVLSKPVAEAADVRRHHQMLAPRSAEDIWRSAQVALTLCDGEYSVLDYAEVFDLQKPLSQRFDATVNGSNGEICKGYWWELLSPFTGRVGHFDAYRVAAGRFAFAGERPLLAHEFPQSIENHMADLIRSVNRGFEEYPNTANMDNVYLTLRMQRWQGRLASATNRIWPCISPFMFSGVMGQALASPPAARLRNRMPRRVIEILNPQLARLPVTGGGPAQPLRLSTAHRFTPLAAEYGRKLTRRILGGNRRPPITPNPVRELWAIDEVRETLHVPAMRSAGLYDPGQLDELLLGSQAEVFEDSRIFGRLLTLECLARAVYAPRQTVS